jgi:energy-coupling factor transporter transmembrane protein EcfT
VAELTAFGYFSGSTLLHLLDARFKLLFIILLSLVVLNLHFLSLGILSCLLPGVIIYSRLPMFQMLKQLRYLFILLIFVFAARVLSTGGDTLIDLKLFSITHQGLRAGALVSWRLALVVLLAFTIISTTLPTDIKAAVQWYLKPVPLLPEKKVAIMMGLILRFIPVIFDQAAETAEAQKARCVQNRKNPVYRLIKLGFPLIRRTFERADDLVAAMEARGFNENRTDPELIAHRRDWIALGVVTCLCIGVIVL